MVILHVDGRKPEEVKVQDLRRSDHYPLPHLRLQLHWGSLAASCSTAQGALLSVEDKEERRGQNNSKPNSTHVEVLPGLGAPFFNREKEAMPNEESSRKAHPKYSVNSCGLRGVYFKQVKISKAGISIIEELPPPGERRPRELLFCNLELVRLDWKKDYQAACCPALPVTVDVMDQQLKLAISGAQVDCQLPGRSDARSDRKSDHTLGGVTGQELPAVILANRGQGDRAFLSLQIKRCVSTSGDYLLPFVNMAMDSVDLTLDDGWLDPLQVWAAQLSTGASAGRSMQRFQCLAETAGKPVLEGYTPPPLPAVIQVDNFFISKVELTVWCALKLRTVRFLPQWIRTAIGMLSLSGELTLDGVELKLPEQKLQRHRGSLTDFLRNLGSMYAVNLLTHAAGLLGKSSVLNLPRVPWRIGMTAFSYVSDSVGLLSGEAPCGPAGWAGPLLSGLPAGPVLAIIKIHQTNNSTNTVQTLKPRDKTCTKHDEL
ncbi:unnamed protein product [Cladocopium goreaui]|uniref:Peroxin/Ferlin domain-containing protein n=1 Tax=Cladocopium goreaui TaxID=2562237 RepID=A0A9P1DNX9_9DINO|nr:unnamed protein product [Cladocopium goreaui]